MKNHELGLPNFMNSIYLPMQGGKTLGLFCCDCQDPSHFFGDDLAGLNPKPQTPNCNPYTLHPKPYTLNLKPQPLNPKP